MSTYTLEKIDGATITKKGRELFERMPEDIRSGHGHRIGFSTDRVITILSLLARNGAKAWTAWENGCNNSPMAEYYYRRAWSCEGDERARLFAKADRSNERWTAQWEKASDECDRRMSELAALLTEITGHQWRIDQSGGGTGDVLVVPDTATGARPDSTTYHTNEPGIWLNG
jgi:hypothetical protein